MATARHYSRSPITEAIIDFQVELPEGVGLSDLERCQDAAYPGKKALTDATATASRPVGFLFTSADGKQLSQARVQGFTMHRLAPYQGWQPFRDEARRLWDVYRQAVRPRQVTRLAVRFIHRLDLPLPVGELRDYLRTSPELSPELPQGLAGFFLQLNIPQQDSKSTLLLRELVVPPATPEVASVVLDIDLLRTHEIPANDAGMWALIDSFRDRKNEVFEACITDRTREVLR
jgi:uncharacterized protein (TIGR04255 family)